MTEHGGGLILSGFGDEIAPDIATQLDTLHALGLSHIDLRGVGDQHVIDLDDQHLASINEQLTDRGFGVTSIGSPIGKIDITAPFGPHLDRFKDALAAANRLDADYLRVFSYYLPSGDAPEDWRADVVKRLEHKTELAEQAGVQLVLENERGLYGETPTRVQDLLTTIDSPALRAVFDPANFIAVNVPPYPEAFSELAEFIVQVHIKDTPGREAGQMVPPGQGAVKYDELLRALDERGFSGVLSLEPHLMEAGPHGGFSGKEGFGEAAQAVFELLDHIGAVYR